LREPGIQTKSLDSGFVDIDPRFARPVGDTPE
jgi:hypothetical protein